MIMPDKLRKLILNQNNWNHIRIKELSKKYFTKNDPKILDLGSGDGALLENIFENLSLNQKNGYCAELDKNNLKILKKKKFNIKSFDLNNRFPYNTNFFDYIIANQVIEHLYFTDEFIKEIKRVLRPGGILILSTTNLSAIQSRLLLLFGFMPNSLHPSTKIVGTFLKKKGNNPLYGHKSVFTGKALKEFVNLYNFKILTYETQSVILMPQFLSRIVCHIFDFGTHVNIVAKNV